MLTCRIGGQQAFHMFHLPMLQALAHWRVRSRQVLLRFETSGWGRLRLRPGRAQRRRGSRWRHNPYDLPGSMP